MTDEERHKLIADLRVRGSRYCPEAADELERLAALAQSNAEPSHGVHEALERAVMLLRDAEVICRAASDRGPATYYNMAEAFKQGCGQCQAALTQSDAEPVAWREALEQHLFDLVELARDKRGEKPIPAEWLHPRGALVSEFSKRIAVPPRPDASAGLIEAAEWHEQKARTTALSCAKEIHLACAEALRARAADRSEK